MSTLGDDFRKRSEDQASASATMFEAEDYATNPKKQALAIIGQLNSTMYSALAETLDFLIVSARSSPMLTKMMERAEKNNAIRMAAAKGDWNEFDRIVAGISGGVGSDQGSGSTPGGV